MTWPVFLVQSAIADRLRIDSTDQNIEKDSTIKIRVIVINFNILYKKAAEIYDVVLKRSRGIRLLGDWTLDHQWKIRRL